MIYPDNFEDKVGFRQVRAMVESLAVSPLGKAEVGDMAFSSSADDVRRRLEETAEMLNIINGPDDLPIDNFRDVTPMLKLITVPGTSMRLVELVALSKTLAAIADVIAFMSARRGDDGASPAFPHLDDITSPLNSFQPVARAINAILDPYGNIKDTASPELQRIRGQLSSMSGTINSIMRRVMARAVNEGYLDHDVTPSVRDGRLVIPVAPMHKRKIQGIVHDESASGKTFFIEPAEVVEANNRLRELEMEEKHEIKRILTEMANQIRPEIPEMLISIGIMGRLDFIRAKARFARDVDACLPNFNPGRELEWYRATHPVLLHSLRRQGKEIVPLDITLSADRRLLLISGPNAGGKSVCLKTVGIIQYMIQCGLLPPLSYNSHIGIFDDIFIDIGDNQSIEDDLSTYSSHLNNMKQFLSRGRAGTLLLIDEFGSGTEPQIGGALAQAILKQLNAMSTWGVITTHYQNLKQLAEETPGLVNGSMLYDRQKMTPLFKLSIGNAGSSFAIEIARKIGLPKAIIDDATDIVGSDYVNLDRYLLDVARDKRYWENKRQAIKEKEKKIENLLARYEDDAAQLRQRRREIIADAQDEARRIIEQSNSSVERAIHDIRVAQAEREKTLEARRKLQTDKQRLAAGDVAEHPLLAKVPKNKKKTPKAQVADRPVKIEVGDNVKLDGQGTVGTVLEVGGRDALVAFGMLKTKVKLDRLKPTMSKPQGAAAAQSSSFVSVATRDRLRERQLNFKQEIDVRGMRADEAIQAVTYFIDDAVQFNAKEVRILHGTGTGVLRQVLRQYLDTVPGVSSYRDEHVQFGGAGITVVTLA